jgi:hypothetical protein
MTTIAFDKIGESTDEQQIQFGVEPGLPTIQNQIGFTELFSFQGGDFSSSSILTAARTMIDGQKTSTPLAGGTLTINGESVGSYDYKVANTTTISSFTASNWFTSTEDTRSSWILVNGNLTINSGITFIPSVRKLFTVVYVTGNLVVNGVISMTARGANHSGTGNSGGYTAPVDIRIGTGSFGSGGTAVTDPQIPATGGAGAARKIATTGTSSDDGWNVGTAGTLGGTGGAGGGYLFSSPINSYAGKGGDGTCFSGGSGSGSCFKNNRTGDPINSEDAVENGGAGTAGVGSTPVGGSGNPPGTFGGTGTGGVVIVICEGALSGSGSVRAQGISTTSIGGLTGGASGGGSVNVLFGTNPSGVSVLATGGDTRGGANGTARKFSLNSN